LHLVAFQHFDCVRSCTQTITFLAAGCTLQERAGCGHMQPVLQGPAAASTRQRAVPQWHWHRAGQQLLLPVNCGTQLCASRAGTI
jgi:hypothetical protein